MLLRMKVKAGILLYALLMSAVFTLLLQFYLNRMVAAERQHQAQITASQAFLMAEVTRDLADSSSGTVIFTQGRSSYKQEADKLNIQVQMDNGKEFSYLFHYEKQNKNKQEAGQSVTEDTEQQVSD
ncbi:competence type IV pilus minor pilin ComGG [Streptococcus sp. H49]|uniref:competence type IV pilus minor pilin ComGG n=1 Tax=Streptococcus huangxiaojuni TaxID=3237239 RepID=UPI0034A0EBD8